jgi:ribonuclease HI
MNPCGLLTWAFIAKLRNIVVHSEKDIVGWGKGMTNNLGEMTAVLAAVHWLVTLPTADRYPVVINSDSQLIVKQCAGTWNCNDEKLQVLLSLIQRGRAAYGKAITFRWIPRTNNIEADALSRSLYVGREKALEMLKKHKTDIQFDWDDLSF